MNGGKSMSNLITISGVRGYIDENGVAQLNLEDVARGLGFTSTETKSGKEYESVRWSRVNGHLAEFGLLPQVAESFIPENIFYRLAMKAKNETAEAFQAIVADEILPAIRRTGMYVTKPMSQLEILAQATQSLLEQDKEIKRLAAAQQEQANEIKGIREIVALSPNDWRRDATTLINKIAKQLGGNELIQDVRKESYKLLDERFGVNLKIRLTNKRKNMSLEGVSKSKIASLNYLDVIAEDKKLIEGYLIIVKEMAIKYGDKTA
jgi:prophage antirepressor-like protein